MQASPITPSPAPRSARANAPWIDAVADSLWTLDQIGSLPPVSSGLSGVVTAIADSGPAPRAEASPRLFRQALLGLAEAYATLLRGAFPSLADREDRHPLRILSLCTGYDAAVELLALDRALGPIGRYQSVDIDADVAATNRLLSAGCPCVDESSHIAADIRDLEPLHVQLRAAGPVDACIALHPPIFATQYGDTRRAGAGRLLSGLIHESVLLELLLLKQEVLTDTPVCILTYVDDELAELQRMAAAFGSTSRAVPPIPIVHPDMPPVTLRAAILT